MPADPEPAPPWEVTASGPGPDGGWLLAVLIPAGTPLCEGHFPGHPIVPGVTQLALVERAVGDWQGEAGLAAVPTLRLRQPVMPGDELEVRVREGDGGSIVFEVRRGGAVVANGSVRPGTASSSGLGGEVTARSASGSSAASAFPPVPELIPHRGAFQLVREVLAADPESLTARAAVPLANPLAAAGLAPPWLALEAAAQAAALHEALARAAGPPDLGAPAGPRIGYLVSVRDAALAAPFPAGAPLLATVRGAGGAGGLATYEAEVVLEDGGTLVARGRLGTFSPG